MNSRALARPGWVEVLKVLGAEAPGPGAASTPGEGRALELPPLRLSFLIVDHGGGYAAAVARCQVRRPGGGYKASRRLWLEDLAAAEGRLAPEDQAVLDRLGQMAELGAAGPPVGLELEALIGHPRVFLPGVQAPIALRPAMLGLAVAGLPGGGCRIDPCVDGAPLAVAGLRWTLSLLPPRQPFFIGRPERGEGLVVQAAHLPLLKALLHALEVNGQEFPEEAVESVLDRLQALPALVPLTLAPELAGEERPPGEALVVQVEVRRSGLALEVLARPLEGGLAVTPGAGPGRLAALTPSGRIWCRRDLPRERQAAGALLAGLPLAEARDEGPFRRAVDDDGAALELVTALRAIARPEVAVAWDGPPPRVVRASGGEPFKVRVSDRNDWFGLDGELEFGGEQVALALLLDAVRRGRSAVRLSDGGWLQLSGLLLERLRTLAHVSWRSAAGVEAGPAAAFVLEELAGDGATLDAEGAFARLRDAIRAASREPPALPAAFQGTLRDYQLEGFRWMARLSGWGAGAVLADDMGLGKTAQALALLCHRAPIGPALVAAPTSVCSNWSAEARRFAPGLRVRLYRGGDRQAAVEGLGPWDVLVVSWGLLEDAAGRLGGRPLATLVLDEAQAIKNAATRRARAARALDAGFRLALSGTPLENHLGELWSLFRTVFPGLLGSWRTFRERFAVPIERRHDEARRLALAATVRPFLLRRTKAEVARELPGRTELAVPVALGEEERHAYDDLRVAALARLAQERQDLPAARRRFLVLAAITRLRLQACHPRLLDPGSRVPSAKLASFLSLVEALRAEGHRTLVFSQFTRHLALVRQALGEAGIPHLYLDGRTPPRQRDQGVARFQAGEAPLFLISLRAGGTGLNLTAADTVVHLDPWWNPAVEDQATDRAYRIGQRRPVTVHRLVSQGTIEEAIVGLHARKRALAGGMLAGMEAAGRLSTEELVELITSPTGAERSPYPSSNTRSPRW